MLQWPMAASLHPTLEMITQVVPGKTPLTTAIPTSTTARRPGKTGDDCPHGEHPG